MSGNLDRALFRTCGCSLSVNSVNAPSFPMVKVISIAYTDSASSVNRRCLGAHKRLGGRRRKAGTRSPVSSAAAARSVRRAYRKPPSTKRPRALVPCGARDSGVPDCGWGPWRDSSACDRRRPVALPVRRQASVRYPTGREIVFHIASTSSRPGCGINIACHSTFNSSRSSFDRSSTPI